MASCLGKAMRIHKEFVISSKLYNLKFYSALYPINHSIYDKNMNEKCMANFLPNTSCRHFSFKNVDSFYGSIFSSISESSASHFVKDTLINIHDVTGLHWGETIFATTVALKLLIGFPIEGFQQYFRAKLVLTKIEFQEMIQDIRDKTLLNAMRGKWTQKKANLLLAREVRKTWSALVVKNNCHPFKLVILNLAQFPVWILMSITLRKMAVDATLNNPELLVTALHFQVGGVFWSPNLTLPDTTLILPSIITLLSFIILEINVLSATSSLSFLSKAVTNFMRFITLIAFPISMYMPTAVTMFWATSITCGLAQKLLFLSPRVKRVFRIPETPEDINKPYSYMAHKFMQKCNNFFNFFSGRWKS